MQKNCEDICFWDFKCVQMYLDSNVRMKVIIKPYEKKGKLQNSSNDLITGLLIFKPQSAFFFISMEDWVIHFQRGTLCCTEKTLEHSR